MHRRPARDNGAGAPRAHERPSRRPAWRQVGAVFLGALARCARGDSAGQCDASVPPAAEAAACPPRGGPALAEGAGPVDLSATPAGGVDAGAPIGRPCGCVGGTVDMLACAAAAAPADAPKAEDASSVLVVMPVPEHVELYARYSAALTAAHLAAHGHGLMLERSAPPEWAHGSGAAHRTLQVRGLLALLRRLARPGSGSPAWGWLLLLSAEAAIVTDEDVLRRALRERVLGTKTHVVVSAHGRNGTAPDGGIVLVRNARWSEGFLAAWLQELSTVEAPGTPADLDASLAAAVVRARKLGGPEAVVELPAGALSADFGEHTHASVRDEPVVHLRGAADEVLEHFFRAAWHWACRRPGGLWGGAPATLQRHHLAALDESVRLLMGARKRPALHLAGRPLQRREHPAALLDALAGYAPLLGARGGRDSQDTLRVCVLGYQWADAGEEPGAKLCQEHLRRLGES
mmetsp:Transcript_30341/g.61023  ORF Transcript_30341/g.61023 Transcript_30341/m.61023 type:complete len:461 (+) Transcript_30341:74-1456(+)